MPQAIFVGLGLLLESSLGAFLIVNSALLSTGALLVGGLAYSASKARSAKRKAREQFNAAQVDRLVYVPSATAPRELVMGRVRKGGAPFFQASTGTNKTKFVMCIPLAAHEIDAVEQIYFNDEPVNLDGLGNVTTPPYGSSTTPMSGWTTADAGGNATLLGPLVPGTLRAYTGTSAGRDGDLEERSVTASGLAVTTYPGASVTYQYTTTKSFANVRWVLGSESQSADDRMITLFPSLWTSAHRARSVAYLICEFDYNETAFPTGLPNVTALVRGAKVYDPRSGATAWSDNPALLIRHVRTHPWFGKATPSAAEDTRIGAVASACDTPHGYVVSGVTTTVPLYRAGVVIPFGAGGKDAIDDLVAAMAGSWALAGGEIYLRAGVFTSSVMSLTDADVVGIVRDGSSEQDRPLVIRPHRERVEKFNVVNLQIWDSDQAYKRVSLTPLKGSALIARDGAELAQPITLAAVGYAPQAQHIAGVMMRDARDPLTVTMLFKTRAYPLELFDTIDLTVARYGWAEKLFQVVGRDWSSDGSLSITLKEIAAAHYTPDGTFDPQGYAKNTQLPSPWDLPIVGPLMAYSGTAELLKLADGSILSRMRLTWPAVNDASVTESGIIEIQYRSVLEGGDWSRIEAQGNDTEIVIAGVQDSNAYTIRARPRNKVAVGKWSAQITHMVIGKTELPPPFDTFTVLAQPDGTRQLNFGYATAAPADWLGAQIRYLAGTHLAPDWSAMAVLSDSRTYYTASPVEANAPSSGTYTFACRSMDTSGNLSPYLLHTITLPDRRLGSVFDEFAEDPVWPGAKTGCFVNEHGELESTNTSTWGTGPATWSAWTSWAMSPTSPIVYATPAQDLGTPITGQLSATVDADGTTLVEVATSPDGVSWSSWGSVASPFSAQHIKLRLTVTATGPAPVPLVRAFSWVVDAPILQEYLNDLDISTLTGSYRVGTGDIRVPVTLPLTVLKRLQVTIQDSTAGTWSWQLIDKTLTYGPRVQFKLGGTLADPALVDFFIEGF